MRSRTCNIIYIKYRTLLWLLKLKYLYPRLLHLGSYSRVPEFFFYILYWYYNRPNGKRIQFNRFSRTIVVGEARKNSKMKRRRMRTTCRRCATIGNWNPDRHYSYCYILPIYREHTAYYNRLRGPTRTLFHFLFFDTCNLNAPIITSAHLSAVFHTK